MTPSPSQSGPRYLIVNADDFGYSPGVNRGILHAHTHGIVTSTSLMARAPAAHAAARLPMEHPRLGVGLHVDLAEWVWNGAEWVCGYEVVPADNAAAVAEEVHRQLAAFKNIMQRNPTHLDSHQHVHKSEPAQGVLKKIAAELKIPLRHYTKSIRYDGNFYGQDGKGNPYPQALEVEALLKVLETLPAGITELGCHPGFADDPPLDSVYREERAVEVQTLCDPRICKALGRLNIQLRHFAEVPQASPVDGPKMR